jgi:hypothetical protein
MVRKFTAIERQLEKLAASIVPRRPVLRIIVHNGEPSEPAMAQAVEEHLRANPNAPTDVGDYDWIIRTIVNAPEAANGAQ